MSKKFFVVATFTIIGLSSGADVMNICDVTYSGETFKECKAKMIRDLDNPRFVVKSVFDRSKIIVDQTPVASVEKELTLEEAIKILSEAA